MLQTDELIIWFKSLRWGFVLSMSAACISFSVVHYVSYMTWFKGSLLLVFPSSFYFDFAFVLFLHVTIGLLVGRLFLASGLEILPAALDASFNIRRWRVGRGVIIFFHRLQRNKLRARVLAIAFAVSTVLLIYVGVIRFILLALVMIFVMNVITGVNLERRNLRDSVLKMRRGRVKPLHLIASPNFWTQRDDVSIRGFVKDCLSLDFLDPESISGAALGLAVLLLAVASGVLRGDRLTDSVFHVTLHTDDGSMLGSVYASSEQAIMFWRETDGNTFLVPNGAYTIEAQ